MGWHEHDEGVFIACEQFFRPGRIANLIPSWIPALDDVQVPNALSQPGGYALGAQAGEAAIRQVTADAGFTRFRRAAETPFNLVYEVRP